MSAKPEARAEDMVNIEIDGVSLTAPKGSMIIHAADEANIYIPRFCYHKKLPIAANCRMCLVEVEKAPKPMPACATPVAEGMRIYTRSPKACTAQRGVMEFLLINHPLDCPICDQGGECELQDLALGYGRSISRFTEKKRVVKDQNLGPLVATEMTRCIHCTRCIRVLEVVAGKKELGATGRGEHTRIGTFIEQSVDSELSGNVIDVCPVGALTSKPFRFRARAWEMRSHDGIGAHDCVGSNIDLHTYHERVMRVVPRENEEINEVWLSDRDRFSYEGLNSDRRLLRPMVRRGDEWEETDWNTALDVVSEGMREITERYGAQQLGALASPNCTSEEFYLLQKLFRTLGSDNVDHRLRQMDFRDQAEQPVFPSLGRMISEVENLDACLLIGSNVRMEQPMIAHRLRKMALGGGHVMFVNPLDYAFNFPVAERLVVRPAAMVLAVAGIAKALLEITRDPSPHGLAALVDGVPVEEEHRRIADRLKLGTESAVVLGTGAMHHPYFGVLRALAGVVAEMTESSIGYLPEGANSAGAWLAGAVPHRNAAGEPLAQPGLDVRGMFSEKLKGYLLLGMEPEHDCADAADALRSLRAAELVAVLTPFRSTVMEDYAHVLLPVAPFAETGGTFVNVEGRRQGFHAAVKPAGEARPAWKVLRVLGNLLECEGFEYAAEHQIGAELEQSCGAIRPDNRLSWKCPGMLPEDRGELVRLAEFPAYSVDGVVRRARALQETVLVPAAGAYMNESTLKALGLAPGERVVVSQGEQTVSLTAEHDPRLPERCVVVSGGTAECGALGAPFAAIEIGKD